MAEIQESMKEIPDEVLVALVGDMVTEEALPTYQTMLNTLDGTKDETGANCEWNSGSNLVMVTEPHNNHEMHEC